MTSPTHFPIRDSSFNFGFPLMPLSCCRQSYVNIPPRTHKQTYTNSLTGSMYKVNEAITKGPAYLEMAHGPLQVFLLSQSLQWWETFKFQYLHRVQRCSITYSTVNSITHLCQHFKVKMSMLHIWFIHIH